MDIVELAYFKNERVRLKILDIPTTMMDIYTKGRVLLSVKRLFPVADNV